MIVAVNRIFVKDEHKADFERRFSGRSRLVEKMPGFVSIEILKPLDGNDYLIMTKWRSKEDFMNWVNSAEFKRAHQGDVPGEWFLKENEFSLYEVIED
jgi:heme-degrading monooxygenase HmoA